MGTDINTDIRKGLFELRDTGYAEFQSKLVPNLPPDSIIGVRIPLLRKFAKECIKTGCHTAFMADIPHKYYDENMLHGLLISEMKDFDECIDALGIFLPYIDNWAVCDTLSPKVFKRHKDSLLPMIRKWSSSPSTYICRFGLEMLMTHFLDDDFKEEYLEIPARIRSEEYYVNMMIAWFFATALAKQWESSIAYIQDNLLDVWTHNKTIQKARESYRISTDQKSYLKTLKRTDQ